MDYKNLCDVIICVHRILATCIFIIFNISVRFEQYFRRSCTIVVYLKKLLVRHDVTKIVRSEFPWNIVLTTLLTIYPLFNRLLQNTFQKSKLRLVFARFIRGTFYETG